MTPSAAPPSCAAQVNKLDGRIGTLEAGKLADVIVVDGNPARGPRRASSRVRMTFLEGKRMV